MKPTYLLSCQSKMKNERRLWRLGYWLLLSPLVSLEPSNDRSCKPSPCPSLQGLYVPLLCEFSSRRCADSGLNGPPSTTQISFHGQDVAWNRMCINDNQIRVWVVFSSSPWFKISIDLASFFFFLFSFYQFFTPSPLSNSRLSARTG